MLRREKLRLLGRRQLLSGMLALMSLSVSLSAWKYRPRAQEASMAFQLLSPAFAQGQVIPARYTCDGDDISPPLRWSEAPAGTRSLALLCSDPDAPAGTWWHWAVYDIGADSSALPEAYPTDARVGPSRQATNDFRRTGYGGPCPPPGHGVHHYHFRLLALSVERLELGEGARCPEVGEAAAPHVLAQAELIGTYSR